MKLYLFKVSRPEGQRGRGFEVYDAYVGIFASEEEARFTHPWPEEYRWAGEYWERKELDVFGGKWVKDHFAQWIEDPRQLKVQRIGEIITSETGVLLTDYASG